jgi:hypothetical protein
MPRRHLQGPRASRVRRSPEVGEILSTFRADMPPRRHRPSSARQKALVSACADRRGSHGSRPWPSSRRWQDPGDRRCGPFVAADIFTLLPVVRLGSDTLGRRRRCHCVLPSVSIPAFEAWPACSGSSPRRRSLRSTGSWWLASGPGKWLPRLRTSPGPPSPAPTGRRRWPVPPTCPWPTEASRSGAIPTEEFVFRFRRPVRSTPRHCPTPGAHGHRGGLRGAAACG